MDSWIRAQELPKVQRTIQMALLFIFVKLLAGISRAWHLWYLRHWSLLWL